MLALVPLPGLVLLLTLVPLPGLVPLLVLAPLLDLVLLLVLQDEPGIRGQARGLVYGTKRTAIRNWPFTA